MAEDMCSARVYGHSAPFGGATCSRKGKVRENGKLWCKQHAPSSVAAQRDARDKKWAAEWAERDRANAKRSAYNNIAKTAISWFEGSASDNDLERAVIKYRALT